MSKFVLSLMAAVLLGPGAGALMAADPMSDKEATPSIKERITKDTVKGTLMKIDGEHYWILDDYG